MTDTAENMHYSAEYDSVLPDSTAFLRGLAKMSSGHFYSVCGYRHVRPSGAGNWLLFFTLDGRGRIQQPGLRTDALPGDIHLLGPDAYSDYGVPPSEKQKPVPLSKAGSYSNFVRQLHHGQSRPRRSPASFWEFHYIHFLPKEELLPLLNLPDIGAGLGHVRIARPGDRQRIVDAFQRIHRDLIFGHAIGDRLASTALEEIFLVLSNSTGRQRLDPRIADALEAIRTNLSASHTVGSLAHRSGLSPSRFAHLFKDQVGASVIQTVLQLRIQQACRLLTMTQLRVSEIAYALGFRSEFYFSRQFRLLVGQSPKHFRESITDSS